MVQYLLEFLEHQTGVLVVVLVRGVTRVNHGLQGRLAIVESTFAQVFELV